MKWSLDKVLKGLTRPPNSPDPDLIQMPEIVRWMEAPSFNPRNPKDPRWDLHGCSVRLFIRVHEAALEPLLCSSTQCPVGGTSVAWHCHVFQDQEESWTVVTISVHLMDSNCRWFYTCGWSVYIFVFLSNFFRSLLHNSAIWSPEMCWQVRNGPKGTKASESQPQNVRHSSTPSLCMFHQARQRIT